MFLDHKGSFSLFSIPLVFALPPLELCPLTDGWRTTLPKTDHQWVSRALFHRSTKGKSKVDYSKVNRLWYYPPQTPLICSQPPKMAQYFTRRLLLWMPRKLWAVKLLCPTATCAGQELTSAGMHTVVRHVLDIDGWYNMASEYLECKTCKKKYIGWSSEILKQLDVSHRVQFPAVLTYRYTCDPRLVRLLRMRGV